MNILHIVTFVDYLFFVEIYLKKSITYIAGEGMDTSKASRNYHPKTLKNEHGNYPVWMNQRRVKKIKKAQRKKAKAKAKKK